MARLSDEMRAAAKALEDRASGYLMTGGRPLANTAYAAAVALNAAADACDRHNQREAEALATTGDRF